MACDGKYFVCHTSERRTQAADGVNAACDYKIIKITLLVRNIPYCSSCVYNCADQSCLHIFLRSSNIRPFMYHLHPLPFTGILQTHTVTTSWLDSSVG